MADYLDPTGLRYLLGKLKALVNGCAAATHTHAAGDITSGALGLARGGTGQTTALAAAKALGRGYGTCATAAGTAAKVGSLSGFVRQTGAVVAIKFSYANTAASPTLNVNGTGAAAIYDWRTNTYPVAGRMDARVHQFAFNGSQWVLLNPVAEKIWPSITVPVSAWAVSGGLYYATVSVTGMLATDNPHSVDIVRSSDADADALCEEAFGLVTRITTADGSITLRAGEAPTVAFNIWMEASR